MSIQSEITRIEDARNDIITSLQSKGSDIETGAKIDTIASFITALSTGGGSIVLKAQATATTDNPAQFKCDIGEAFDFTKENWFIIGRISTSSSSGLTLYVSPDSNFTVNTALAIGSVKQSSGENQQGTFIITSDATINTINGDEIAGTKPTNSYRYFGFFSIFGNTNILSGSTIKLYVVE